MLNRCNPFAQKFRMASQRVELRRPSRIKLKLISTRNKDGRMYNLPTGDEVAALIENDIDTQPDTRDIIVEEQNGALQRIHEFSPNYLPLQYPLLFPYGEDGYYASIPRDGPPKKKSNISLKEFISFRLFDRNEEGGLLMHCGRLLQQFIVDAYVMIDTQRLQWIRYNQHILRVENYRDLSDAANRGDASSSTGRRIVLPSSYTGGPRWTIQNYQDTLAICKSIGYPALFITFTCNPKWPEIIKYTDGLDLTYTERPDIVTRVFKMKLDEMITDFQNGELFGPPRASKYILFCKIIFKSGSLKNI